MSNESLLKKEFKQSDVQRVRNIVNKDFTASTKQQSGYKKVTQRHKEGDIWEENGKTWTIKNGLKQNVLNLILLKKHYKYLCAVQNVADQWNIGLQRKCIRYMDSALIPVLLSMKLN